MTDSVIPLSAPAAADASRVGPKAANLAALGHAGLPIPDGFCVEAQIYRAQIAALGLEQTSEAFCRYLAAHKIRARTGLCDERHAALNGPRTCDSRRRGDGRGQKGDCSVPSRSADRAIPDVTQ